MKKILSILLCTLVIFLSGCGNASPVNTVTSNNDKYKIRDNYLESIQTLFPNDIFVVGMDVDNEPYNVQIVVHYKNDIDKTMLKMAEILKSSEEFYKTQKVEYVYFSAVDDKNNNKGKFTLHLENDNYVIAETTLE